MNIFLQEQKLNFSKIMRLFSFLIFSLFLHGCLTGPDDRRSNPNDPKSPEFIVEFTQPSALANTENRNLRIFWQNKSSYTEGFIIEKKLDNKFVSIDTLGFVSAFTDSSNEYSLELTYRVTSFLRNEKGKIRNKYSQKTDSIDYGNIRNVAAFADSDTLKIQWFRNTRFDDLTVIDVQEQGASSWSEFIQIEYPQDEFIRVATDLSVSKNYNFRIRLYLRDHKNNLVKYHESITSYTF